MTLAGSVALNSSLHPTLSSVNITALLQKSLTLVLWLRSRTCRLKVEKKRPTKKTKKQPVRQNDSLQEPSKTHLA